ncbi:hypothetical protein FXO38_04470 [Capsicum annuum]|nr:hypothetical protein FXO38_04470 [Capsicum annuum]KAF3683571.1 hypothetical protein FXO37_01763 [Capsicum annuum]
MDVDSYDHRRPASPRISNNGEFRGGHEPGSIEPPFFPTLESPSPLKWTKTTEPGGYIFSSGSGPTNTNDYEDLGKRKNIGYVKNMKQRNGSFSRNHDSPNYRGNHPRQTLALRFGELVSEMWIVLLPLNLTKFTMKFNQPSVLTGGIFKTTPNPLKSMINVNLPQSSLKPLDKGRAVTKGHLQTQSQMMMNIIVWNARGANNAEFKIHCGAMIDLHKPAMLALLETRMADHHTLTHELSFDSLL